MKTAVQNQLYEVAEAFIAQLHRFECTMEFDPTWEFYCRSSVKKWYNIRVSIYQGIYYLNEHIHSIYLEIEPSKKRVEASQNGFSSYSNYSGKKQWITMLNAGIEWMQQAQKNWVGTYKECYEQLPLKYRKGFVPTSIVTHYFPNFNFLQKELGIANTKKMIAIIEQGKLRAPESGVVERMTANGFFEYCKIAYIAVGKAKRTDKAVELYRRLADGRHEGLLEIDAESEKEFEEWIDKTHPKRSMGGHPWEVLRGGNTSNIQIRVSRPYSFDKKNFKIEVYPTGISRLAEAIKIFLAIYKSGMPVSIPEPNTIREQLLLLDNVGIIPDYQSLHRANQAFEKSENVNIVTHLYEIKKHLSKIKPFIIWEPLPVMPIKKV